MNWSRCLAPDENTKNDGYLVVVLQCLFVRLGVLNSRYSVILMED